MTKIHPTALVDEGATLADDVEVGAYSIIEDGVKIDAGTTIGPHCYVSKGAVIGEGNTFTAFVSVGTAPQDLTHKDCESTIQIGDRNTFREFVSLNRGTPKEDCITIIGSDNFVMASAHVGHDYSPRPGRCRTWVGCLGLV